MPRVSVIIPTHNRAHLVTQAIDSVLAQTYTDYEVVVVDDGSSDNTRLVLSRYGDRIRYIYQDQAGAGAARNTAIRAARGELLSFLDSDDLYSPIKLACQVAYLDEHPECGAVYCGWQLVDQSATHVLNQVTPTRQGNLLKDLLLDAGPYPPVLLTTGIMLRREVIDQVGDFDTSLETLEDIYLWSRMGIAGIQFGCVSEPLCQWRETPASLGRDLAKLERTVPVLLHKILDEANPSPEIAALRVQVTAASYLSLGLQYYDAYLQTLTGELLDHALNCLGQAVTAKPDILDNRTEFWDKVSYVACSFPAGARAAYIEHMARLYTNPARRRAVRRHLWGNVEMISAFGDYVQGKRRQVVTEIVRGLLQSPGWLLRPGVLSMLVMALLGIAG